MAILDKIFNKTKTDVTVETEVVETVVTSTSDISIPTIITGKTEAIIYSTED
jgi:hypothetical protein